MDYQKQLNEIRNKMHCNIVQEATVFNCVSGNSSDGVLLLKKPVDVGNRVIQSVCCETGYLISSDDRIVRYQDLSIDEMCVIHRELVELKKYTFTLNAQLV